MLAAVTAEVGERGLSNTNVARVIDRAAVTPGAFDTQFSDLEACFLAAYTRAFDAIAGPLRAEVARHGGTSHERIVVFTSRCLQALASDPVAARAFLVEFYAAGNRVIQQRRSTMLQFALMIQEVGRELVAEAGRGQAPDRFTAEALVHGIDGIIAARVAAGQTDRLRELGPQIVRFIETQLGVVAPG